jgi:RNA polymerase sigma factor (sigma-70 family)
MTRPRESWQGIDVLYAELQPRLWRILVGNLRVADDVLEDACQNAWSALLVHRDSITPGHELGWLSTTATREALRIIRAGRRLVPLDETDEPVLLDDHRASAAEPDRVLELSEKLAEVRALPPRQQRIVWLQGLGYEYTEIAAVTGESRRTVERQLSRARQRLTRLRDID